MVSVALGKYQRLAPRTTDICSFTVLEVRDPARGPTEPASGEKSPPAADAVFVPCASRAFLLRVCAETCHITVRASTHKLWGEGHKSVPSRSKCLQELGEE